MTTDETMHETPPRRRGAFELLFHSPSARITWPKAEDFTPPSTVDEVDALAEQMFTVHSHEQPRPIQTVVLIGSTRFLRLFHEWNAQLSTHGFVVLSLGVNRAKDFTVHLSDREKAILEAVHFQKIAMADAVLAITGEGARVVGDPVTDYIGESTAREIAFAEQQDKPVFYANGLTVAKQYTQPRTEPWANYRDDQLQDRIRDTWHDLKGMLNRSPQAMLAFADSVWDGDAHDEYGWDGKIDENAMAEEPESWPTGARHALHLSAGIGSCILVVDENRFDEGEGEQRVRWHLEPMTAEEKSAREARHQDEMRRIGMGEMVAADLGLPEEASS
ncbi:hypothetical protein [uncultured Reyranella sp.]|uniref:hypothetical protein n=1 Tax=uncultured Reyranella sp. TaxID=735512 RepID=UPI00259D1747|nr:hypothetical protein [uncultured Reyranella sp.]